MQLPLRKQVGIELALQQHLREAQPAQPAPEGAGHALQSLSLVHKSPPLPPCRPLSPAQRSCCANKLGCQPTWPHTRWQLELLSHGTMATSS